MFPSRRSTPDGNVGNDTFPIPFPLPRSKEAGLQLQLRQTVPPKKHPPTKHTCKYASVMPYRVRGVYVNCKAIFYAMHSGRFSSVSDAKVAGSFFLPRAHNRKKNRIRKHPPNPSKIRPTKKKNTVHITRGRYDGSVAAARRRATAVAASTASTSHGLTVFNPASSSHSTIRDSQGIMSVRGSLGFTPTRVPSWMRGGSPEEGKIVRAAHIKQHEGRKMKTVCFASC